MRYKILYIISIIFLLSEVPFAHASFRIKKELSAPANVFKTAAVAESSSGETSAVKVSGFFNTISSAISSMLHPSMRGMAYRGWVGIAAVLCGLAGFAYPLFSILAVLFGFIGMGRGKRNAGLAVAGLLLGLTVLALTVFFSYMPVFLV